MGIDVNMINPFLGAAVTVVKTAANMDVKIGKPYTKETKFTEDSVLIMLGITGQLEGQVIIEMEESNAKNIASGMMMGMPVETIDDMALSAISELGNMIMGNAATIFSTSGTIIDITPPTVARGTVLFSRQYAVNICVPIMKDDKKLIELNIAIKKEE